MIWRKGPYREVRCPACWGWATRLEDFHHGIYATHDGFARHHSPECTLVCLDLTCRSRHRLRLFAEGWRIIELMAGPPDFLSRAERPGPVVRSDLPARPELPARIAELLRYRPAASDRPQPTTATGGERVDPPRATSPDRDEPPELVTIWLRLSSRLNRLFAAMADLNDRGGLGVVASTYGWSRRRIGKVIGRIGLIRAMLGAQLVQLQGKDDDPSDDVR